MKHLLLSSLSILFFSFIIVVPSSAFADATTTLPTETASTTLQSGFNVATPLLGISAVVYDISSSTFIYEKNSTEIRPLASLVKIMTAQVASDILKMQHKLTKTIKLSNKTIETKVDRTLNVGELWDFNDLLHFMLLTSANTAADSIANGIIPSPSFISLMNFKARNLGFSNMKFFNASGLPRVLPDGKELPGSYATAKEVALLMSETYKNYPEILNQTATYNASFVSTYRGKIIKRDATSTDPLLVDVPGIIGGKTGYTDIAGGNLAIIMNTPLNHAVAIVVMGSTIDGRFSDVRTLASSTIDFFSQK